MSGLNSNKIGVGVVVHSRYDKLSALIGNLSNGEVTDLYVINNGSSALDLSDNDLHFNIHIKNLPGASVGESRSRLIKMVQNNYLFMIDSDMLVPHNIGILCEILDYYRHIGGVSGLLLENDRIYGSCGNITEEYNQWSVDINKKINFDLKSGYPFVQCDYMPNVGMYKKECLDDGSWDENYEVSIEHSDFYLEHFENTSWKFGICPNVIIPHNPGGDSYYKSARWDPGKYDSGKKYFLQKWGKPMKIHQTNFIDTYNPRLGGFPPHSDLKSAKKILKEEGLGELIRGIKRKIVWKLRYN